MFQLLYPRCASEQENNEFLQREVPVHTCWPNVSAPLNSTIERYGILDLRRRISVKLRRKTTIAQIMIRNPTNDPRIL